MAVKTPLKIANGEVQQFQTGDTIDPTFLPASSGYGNVDTISTNTSLPADYSVVYVRKIKINSGIKLSLGLGSRLRIL